MIHKSENIADLAAALAVAQGEIVGALKDSANPFFKSKYADLASCWDACRLPLTKNGLAVIQTTEPTDGGLMLVTTLCHSSGQWIAGRLPVCAKDDTAQAQGSGLTYARRYALAGIVGLAQIDDDGEAAEARGAPTITEAQVAFLTALADEVGAELPKFCKYLKVSTLADLPASRFQAAIASLEAKRAK